LPDRSSLAPALRVEVLAHHEEIGDLAAQHALERRAAAEHRRGVRLAQPLVGAARERKEDLQRRIDAEQVREPLEQVPVEAADLALLPLIERGAADPEQRGLLGSAQLPRLGELP
jgi:hypothetical protein